MPMNTVAITTASTERRPSSAQYTSSRWSHSANSSKVSPAPIPNATAVSSHHGLTSPIPNASVGAISISAIPNTRWWMWSPPVVTLPGHHGTLGLRINRVLVRMNRNEPRKPTKTRNTPSLPASRICSRHSSPRKATSVMPARLSPETGDPGLPPTRMTGAEAESTVYAFAMASPDADKFASQAAEHVRKAIESAEAKARQIVADAEQEADRIRSRAEADATERIERARAAVDRLVAQADELRDAVGGLGRDTAGSDPRGESPAAPEIDPTPATVPEPEPAREPEPTPPMTPEPEPAREPEPQPPEVPEPSPPSGDRPSTQQLLEQLRAGNSRPDEGAARLVAMKMALDGKPRDEVERHLAENYELASAGALLDDVYSRAGK